MAGLPGNADLSNLVAHGGTRHRSIRRVYTRRMAGGEEGVASVVAD
ncbi:MAG: hypothetical protein V3U67_01800 [Gemmatimonadota bacterium]